MLRSRTALFVFLGLYALTLVLLLHSKPLWLDEIIDLAGVRDSDLRGVLAFVPGNAGGAPLGYITDFAMIRWLGYSIAAVRFPSVLWTVLGCWGVYLLARQTGLRTPLLAVIAFAVSPLTLRYALEARPYAAAVCWSVFASVVFLSLVRAPSLAKAAAYAVLVAAGLYTQPYSIFVPLAHLLWLAASPKVFRPLCFAASAVALASLSFLPWFFKVHAAWQGAVNSGARFTVSAKDLVLIPHELMGTGFAGAAMAFLAVVMALGWSSLQSGQKLFWGLYAVVPMLLVPASDAYFGYFLAARQLIFVLVPISVLLAASIEALNLPDLRRWSVVIPVALIAAMIYEDVRWVRRSGEGWQAAATELTLQASQPRTCTLFEPGGTLSIYAFFEPGLRATLCSAVTLPISDRVALARSLGASGGPTQRLQDAGFRKVQEISVADPGSDPRLELYRKTVP